jgi:ABC-type multidrug transport system permease subunit
MVVFSFSSVGLGLITASIVNTGNAAGGLAFAWIVPQQIFGSFIPPAIFDMEFLGWVFPSWYATSGIGMLFGGVSFYFWELWVRFGVLVGFTIVVYILGIFLYERKKRK